MQVRPWVGLVSVGTMAAAAFSISAHADPISLILASEPSQESVFADNLKSFLLAVEDSPELEGLVHINSIELAGSDLLDAVLKGDIDLAILPVDDLKKFEIQPAVMFSQPAIFTDIREIALVESSWLGEAALGELATVDLVGLAFWNVGMTQIAGSSALAQPGIFDGLRIYTRFDETRDILTSIGAAPVTLDFEERFTALVTGIIDAIEISSERLPAFTDLVSHVIDHNYRPIVTVLMANREIWHALPAQAQSNLADLARQVGISSTERAGDAAENARERLLSENVTFLSLEPGLETDLRSASLRVWEEYQAEDVAAYLTDAMALVEASRQARPMTPDRAPGREGALELELLFATDRNDEYIQFPDKPIRARNRLGSRRDHSERYCGFASISVDARRPVASDDDRYFDMPAVSISSWNDDASTCLELIRSALAGSASREILIFVHGYNNTFFDAVKRAVSLVKDSSFSGVPLVWSWPSAGGPVDYGYDEDSALWSRPHFRDLLQVLGLIEDPVALHLVAHSMGVRIVLDVLEPLSLTADGLTFQHLIFVAPDVAGDVFQEQVRRVKGLSDRLTLYASSGRLGASGLNALALVSAASRAASGAWRRRGCRGSVGP